MLKKNTIRKSIIAATAFTALAMSNITAMALEMRMGVITPPSHVWTKVANRIAENLPAASNNALTLKVFPAGQLGSEQEMYQQMTAGILDSGLMTGAITSLRAPSISGWFTPYLFKNVEEAIAATKLPAAADMLKEIDTTGVHGLGYTFAGMRHILMSEDAVNGTAELKDKKIRIVPFPAMKVWWQAIGAVPTPVNLTEVYQALQSGLLDGIDIDLDALVGLKFQEVGKSLTITNHMVFPSIMVVSDSAWAKMSADEQKAFSETVAEALAWGSAQQIKAEASNLEKLKNSVAINEIANGSEAFATANKAVQDSFAGNKIIAAFQEQVGNAK